MWQVRRMSMTLMCHTGTYKSYCAASPQLALCLLQNRFSKSILVSPIRSSDPTKSWSNIATVSSDSMGKETVSSTTLDRIKQGKCSQQRKWKLNTCSALINPTYSRTVFDNLKACDKLLFFLNSVRAIFSMHIQTKELLFQECMAQREGLELGKKLSSAQLPILNQVLGCARLLTQSMMTPELAGGKRCPGALC